MASSEFTITQPEQMVVYDKLLQLLQDKNPTTSQREEVVNSFLALGFTVDVADRILSNPQLLQDTIDQMQDSLRQWQADVTLSDENNLREFEDMVISTAGDELISFFNGDNMDMALLNLKKLGISQELLNKALLAAVKQPEHWHPVGMVEKILSIPVARGIGKGVAMGPNNFNQAMVAAAENGHMEIVKLMLLKGATHYNGTMRTAAYGGHIDIVELMLFKGATDYNGAMLYAAKNGHVEIVELMLLKGATYYNWVMAWAAYGGHIDIVKLLISKGATNYDGAMQSAARGGHLNIIRFMMSKGATNYNGAMEAAAKGGYRDIVDLMLSKGATGYNVAMFAAARGGQREIVELMLLKGARNYNWAIGAAAQNGHRDIVELLQTAMQNQ